MTLYLELKLLGVVWLYRYSDPLETLKIEM